MVTCSKGNTLVPSASLLSLQMKRGFLGREECVVTCSKGNTLVPSALLLSLQMKRGFLGREEYVVTKFKWSLP